MNAQNSAGEWLAGLNEIAAAARMCPRQIASAIHSGALRAYQPGGRGGKLFVRFADLNAYIEGSPVVADGGAF